MLPLTPALWLAALAAVQEPILIDCDPGKFSDDNVAISMLSRSRKFQIRGVTVVAGNVWANEGLRNARATLRLLAEEDVPVHLGAQQPLVHTVEMSKKEHPLEFAGAFGLKRPRAETETAVDFLIQSLEREPMTVLAIGPLTNIAQALKKKPAIASRIRRLVIMGGNVYVGGNATKAAEFNFWFDPEAAQTVLRSPIPEKVLFGLDVCNRATYGKKEFDRIAGGGSPVAKVFREQFGYGYPAFVKNPTATGYLWDELAAAFLIDPSLISKTEMAALEVDTVFGTSYGKTVVKDSGQSKTKVALELRHSETLKLYLDLLK